jgi:hypothetical protein
VGQRLEERPAEVAEPGVDDDMTFQGTHRYPDALRRIIRSCLSPGVVPVSVSGRTRGMG